MADLDLSPHPLVVGLGTALKTRSKGMATRAAGTKAAEESRAVVAHARHAAAEAAKELASAPQKAGAPAAAKAAVQAVQQTATDAAEHLASDTNLPELAAFAGYLGGTTTVPPGSETWQVLYLDAKLLTWMLVNQDEILLHQRIADDKAAFNQRDVIWVKAEARVGRSTGPASLWLGGAFTRAADFTAPLAGGTAPQPATGIFCEAQSPDCCPPRTR